MKTIYVDSSALVKRVADEAGAADLRCAIDEGGAAGDRFVSSLLARVEVSRAMRARLDDEDQRDIAAGTYEAFVGVSLVQMTRPIIESARVIGPPVLRSLDAIHIATAIALGADEVWTYDARMAQVAEELGISTRAPS